MQSTVTVEGEFQKNPELKHEDMQALKDWRREFKPNIPEIPDKLLILFLHSSYYDLDKAKRCITRYYELRRNSPDFFSNRDVRTPELQKALSVLHFGIFPVRDPDGNVILFKKLKLLEPSEYVFCDGMKLLGMALDAALYLYGTVPGFVVMFDMAGFRFGHLLRCPIFPVRRMFQYVQEGNPIRLKAIHVANTSNLADKICVVARPFMQKSLNSLLQLHYGDNDTIYEHLPKSCLPSDYGGEHGSVDQMHERFISLMHDLIPYFQEEEAYRTN